MTTEAFAAKARRHWKEWLPNRTAELMASGQFEPAVRAAAQRAQQEKRQLMQAGFQEHEADERVLKEYILLTPEPDAEEDDEELMEKERRYQEMMREQQEIEERHEREREAERAEERERMLASLK